MRPSKWYRPEKPRLRPFLHRIWYSFTRMRGGRHLCKCATIRLFEKEPHRWEGWQRMFEPVRIRKKVYSRGRRVPYWSKK